MTDPDETATTVTPPPKRPGAAEVERNKSGTERSASEGSDDSTQSDPAGDGDTEAVGNGAASRRRRGSRGGRNRSRPDGSDTSREQDRRPDDLPDRHRENKPSAEAADRALVRKPQIGDSMPAPPGAAENGAGDPEARLNGQNRGEDGDRTDGGNRRRRRRGGRGRGGGGGSDTNANDRTSGDRNRPDDQTGRGGRRGGHAPVRSVTDADPIELDDDMLHQRRGRERKGQPVGRYLMAVHVGPPTAGGGNGPVGGSNGGVIQIAVLEGRSLLEHYVSHPADDVSQIHGNIYLGKVQNVLPGMEAAFVDIGTPKNAVLYRSDTRYDAEDIEEKGSNPRIEQILKARQSILCQVSKNPIAHKGARLTQEVSMPGRFVVLIPNSTTYGISKRLPDKERKRLRSILDEVKPKAHGLIVRTAAENVTAEEIQRDVARLAQQWDQIEALAQRSQGPALLYREPDMSVRVIREEFNKEYRKVVIDDRTLYEEVRDYVRSITPALTERVEFYDPAEESLPLLETFHVHEQLHKALDRKVWLPSGGSLIIEGTEALTVIDVNTGKNVGKSSLEETVYRNNLEAAIEIARQLRLRDIGGIIVIDFIDMEVRANRDDVIRTFREALSRDKTRTQVFDISELGLVEMTRKRIGEGLLESFSTRCPDCEGRGVIIDQVLLGGE